MRKHSPILSAFLRLAVALAFVAAPPVCAQSDEPQFEVRGYEIEGTLPIPIERANAVLSRFTGPAVTLSQLRDAAKALETALAEAGYPFYRVVLPGQTAENTVKLRVLTFKLANISITNNQYFSKENVRRSLPALRPGEVTNVAEVARNRAAINEHPSKNVEINFLQSEKSDAVDAEVTVTDDKPQRFFLGLNNIGTRETGYFRATLGYQHTNLWDRDHAVTATFTTSPDHVSDVKQYGLYYRMPFYSVGGALTLFYAYSDVNSGVIANAFAVSGRGTFTAAHWRQHLVPIGAYTHGVEIGLDDRLFENNVVFGGTQLGVNVRSTPVSIGYFAALDRVSWALAGSAQYVHNISFGSDNNAAAYQGNRAGATRDWGAVRVTLDGQWRVPPIVFTARVRAQHSDDALIPGEQFGLGGALSVRGLREREVTGDNGWFTSIEMLGPLPWGGVNWAVFLDRGGISVKNQTAGVPSHQTAASVGVGVRWVVARRFAATLDVAEVLEGTTITHSNAQRIHASVLYYF